MDLDFDSSTILYNDICCWLVYNIHLFYYLSIYKMKYVDCLLLLYLSKNQKQLVHTEQTNRKKE